MTDRDRLIELMLNAPQILCLKGGQATGKQYQTFQNIADHLLANGVIVPPCNAGETVYCLIQGFENPLKATVNRITVQKDAVIISCSVLGYFGQSYMATDFGKTVFLTKEEAEKVLNERNNKNE